MVEEEQELEKENIEPEGDGSPIGDPTPELTSNTHAEEPALARWFYRRNAATPRQLREATSDIDWKRLSIELVTGWERRNDRLFYPQGPWIDPLLEEQTRPPDREPQLKTLGGHEQEGTNEEAEGIDATSVRCQAIRGKAPVELTNERS